MQQMCSSVFTYPAVKKCLSDKTYFIILFDNIYKNVSQNIMIGNI